MSTHMGSKETANGQRPISASDMESNRDKSAHLANDLVANITWHSLSVKVKDRKTKKPIEILSDAHGMVSAGQVLAIMGPSGSSKTTLLNALAHRKAAAGATTTGSIVANGQTLDLDKIRKLSSYVEQEDALIGSLTVHETMKFAAGLALPGSVRRKEKVTRVSDLIASFGLQEQSNTIVGTPIQKGLSGGQKKRLGIASRLVTDPKILFLDEPTSGLDSTLTFEVMNYIRSIAKQNNLIVIASIHQPSTSTFKLFDKLCLLSKGKMCYFGDLQQAPNYFRSIGYPLPSETNPAEFYLELINTDLAKEGDPVYHRIQNITSSWTTSPLATDLKSTIQTATSCEKSSPSLTKLPPTGASSTTTLMTLLHRSSMKAYRDIVAYTIRIIMYLGLAILMGTVFLRFGSNQKYIQPYTNAIFFGGAFMSFMAVAYVPAFLEDYATFTKERANGLVGAWQFMLANFLIGIPPLFVIALLFSVVTYFLIDFHQTAGSFWKYVAWLFLDLLAAESLVVLVSAVFPVFVVALAVTAFANGLWMCVDGFLVPMEILNVFWRYVFHYIDYQAYVFQGMMVNEMVGREYECDERSGGGYACQYPSELNAEGKIDGTAVLRAFNISLGKEGQWFGIMVVIVVIYRLLGYLALRLRN